MPLKRNWILASLMLTTVLAAMDTTIVSTAISQIVSDLGGFEKFSWVFSVYLLAQTVTIPIYGKLSDLFGRKAILIFGTLVFLLGSATSAFAWDIYSLIAFRGLQGLGAGSIMATVNTIAGDIYPVRDRGKIQGILGSIWGISAILGPALGGTLAEYANWRWIFLINIPVGILSIIFLAIFLQENVQRKSPKIDYAGATLVLLIVGLLILYLLETGQSWPLLSWAGLGLPVVIAALTGIAVVVERRALEPILPGWLLRSRIFVLNSLAMLGMGIIMMGPEVFLPTFAQASLDVGMVMSGIMLTSMSIGWPIASVWAGRLYLRIGYRKTSLLGVYFFLAAGLGFLLIPWPQPVWLVILDQALLGAGFGLLSTAALVDVQSRVDWGRRGVVTGTVVFTRNLGQSLGAAIFGAIFNYSLARQTSAVTEKIDARAHSILDVIRGSGLADSTRTFLQKAVSDSMHHIYYGIMLFGVLTFLCLWFLPERGKADHP